MLTTYELCELFGYTKQAFYKRKSKIKVPKYNSELLRSLIVNIRKQLPRTGGKKLYLMLQNEFVNHHISIGRDNFLDFLKAEYLQVPKARRYYKTTNSRHWMKRYPNLISNLTLNRPEQVWVADITYLRTKEKTYYLHLLTDACSKKIVGYQLSDNLMSSTTLKALQMPPIFSHEILENYQNLNKQVTQAITLYNNFRIHMSINMITPNQAHQQKTIKLKQWKKLNRNIINSVTI